MKTATVTWITYNNYGTLLQAYALQKEISLLGHDNKILNDSEILKEYRKNKTLAKSLVTEGEKPENNSSEKKCSFMKRLFRLIRHPGRLHRIVIAHTDWKRYISPYEESQHLCQDFKKEELKILDVVTVDRLQDINEEFELFVAGSDQIWSVFEDIFNPYYYLDFVTKKKISYAPSLGSDTISEGVACKIADLLADFDAISIREKTSSQLLSELTGRQVEWVADPVLLHNKELWASFTNGIPPYTKKYLLCYFLENKSWYFEYAKKLAKRLHLKIILIPNRWDYLSSEYVISHGVGPKEFVSLYQHADYVLTDSYHGSIFSIIFNKEFQYLLRFAPDDPKSQNIRIDSLFGYLGLRSRIVSENDYGSQSDPMDYDVINKKVEELRERSLYYLSVNIR